MSANPSVVLDLIEAFRRSKVMFTAVQLGVFDHLTSAKTAKDLAGGLRTDEEATELLLDACAALKLLVKSGGTYVNTPAADAYLRRDSPDTLAGYILYSERALYPLWGNLREAIHKGTNRWDQTFGSRGALFTNFYSTSESKREFLAGMHGMGVLSSPAVVRAFDLSAFRVLADLGGATGHLVVAACEQYPQMRGVVFDLPEVLAVTRDYLAGSPASIRIELAGGDFFTDPLPPADLYSLGRILHDWSESRVQILIKKIYEQLPAGGGLLIAEKLLDDDKTGPVSALMQSLNMLVCTEGRERTEPEYRALLEAAGFRNVRARRTGAPVDAILAVK